MVGLEAVPVETATGQRSIVLSLNPDTDGLDGAMFTCRATLSDGQEMEETITLRVEGDTRIHARNTLLLLIYTIIALIITSK